MTFTEAAIEVLRREGKPLHFRKITEIAVRENLLDHVGKIPDEVMADQLAAHCRLPRQERLLMPVLPATFALVEWQLDEDPAGLENLIDPPPLDELPYRGRERHPTPARELARAAGRGGDKARRREEGEPKHGRRFPPPAEVAYELVASAGGAMSLGEIAALGAERQLMPDAFGRDHAALASALAEDNRRREAAGRRPLFQIEGEAVTLVSQPEPGERTAAVASVTRAATPGELRRAGLAALRRRLRECDPATFEHVVSRLLERLGYREPKVARRSKDHVLLTARKRMGLVEIRHGFRVLRGGGDATRRDVVETRRDLGHAGAQIGAIVSAGEAQRDARSESSAAGQLPVMLLCGEALAEAFAEASLGCSQVVVPVVDEAFFATAAEAAAREETSRRGRSHERGERGDRDERRERLEARREPEPRPVPADAEAPPERPDVAGGDPAVAAAGEGPPHAVAALAPSVEAAVEGDEDDDGDDEGEEGGEEAASDLAPGEAAPSGVTADGRTTAEGRRRRRRRRRRGGRGRGERGGGVPGEAGAGASASPAPASAEGAGGGGASAPTPAAPAGGGPDPAADGA